MATIRRRGDYQWQAQIRRAGFPPQSKTFETRKDAEAWARALEREMDTGEFIPRGEAARTTIKALARMYEDERVEKMKHPRQESSRLKVAVARFGDYHLSAVTSAMLSEWRDELGKTLSAQTVHHYVGVVGRLYKFAEKDKGIPLPLGNPVKGVRMPSIKNARDRRLEAGEEEKLMTALEKSRSKSLKNAVVFAIETAMRRGEILSLTWENVDLKRRVAHLPETKNGESRDVPLSSKAVALLKSLPRPINGGRVFPVTETAITEGFERAAHSAGLADIRFHDLRHEATSRLAERLQMHELAKVTGHKSPRMLLRYYHPRAEDLARKLG